MLTKHSGAQLALPRLSSPGLNTQLPGRVLLPGKGSQGRQVLRGQPENKVYPKGDAKKVGAGTSVTATASREECQAPGAILISGPGLRPLQSCKAACNN